MQLLTSRISDRIYIIISRCYMTKNYSFQLALEKLGLTQNETKFSLILLNFLILMGMKSQKLGISRSLVYSSLEKMTSLGLLEQIQTNSASSYSLKPVEEIKLTLERDLAQAFTILNKELAKIKPKKQDALFITIQDIEQQKAKLRYLVKTAKKTLFISAGLQELEWIQHELQNTNKDVHIHIFSLVHIPYHAENITIHSKEWDDSFIQSMSSLKDKWRILLIKDKEEMILCGGEETNSGVGVYTKNKMTVTFATEHFIHDVKINNIEKTIKLKMIQKQSLVTNFKN